MIHKAVLMQTHRLFEYVEIEDEARWNAIAATPECKKMAGVHERHHALQRRQQPEIERIIAL